MRTVARATGAASHTGRIISEGSTRIAWMVSSDQAGSVAR